MIHKTAIISPNAQLADNVEVGPNCVIDEGAKIGEGTSVQVGAYITGDTTIGKDCKIFPYAIIGIGPQDLKFAGEPTSVVIGDNNTIREFVTIHKGTAGGGGVTRIGNNNLLMAYSHVAHDCQLGNSLALANASSLAGHIDVESHSVIGGLAGIHQFVQIGRYSIVGGCSGVDRDILPFSQAAGNRARLFGLNLTGLRRAGFPPDKIGMLKEIYHLLFKANLKREEALEQISKEFGEHEEARHIVEFIRRSKRGLCSP